MMKFLGHPSEKYFDMWEFLLRELGAGAKAEVVPGRQGRLRMARTDTVVRLRQGDGLAAGTVPPVPTLANFLAKVPSCSRRGCDAGGSR